MVSTSQQFSLAEYYIGFLKNLNTNSKLDLISQLSLSLKEKETIEENSLQSIFGAYVSDESAEEIISQIRSSRVQNRKIELL